MKPGTKNNPEIASVMLVVVEVKGLISSVPSTHSSRRKFVLHWKDVLYTLVARCVTLHCMH